METLNNGIDKELFDYMVESISHSPFYELVGARVTKLGRGTAEIVVTTAEKHTNPLGIVHGGLIMTVADAAMGNAARTLGLRCVTVDCSTSFLTSAAFGKDIVAKGQVIKSGRNIVFTEAQIWSDSKLLASATGTFFNTGEVELKKG